MAEEFISNHDDYVLLRVKISPNARCNMVDKIHDGRLKIKIAAVPEDCKANKEAEKFLAKKLGIALKNVEIISGDTAREKTVKVSEIGYDKIMTQLDLQ